MNGCDKRAFDSPEEAAATLRLWQQRGRRRALDNAHPYKADCKNPAHRGKFHIGRKHDAMRHTPQQARTRQIQEDKRSRIFGELDDIFDRQHTRITNKFTRDDERRRARNLRDDEGPLVRAEMTPLSGAGDSINVETKR